MNRATLSRLQVRLDNVAGVLGLVSLALSVLCMFIPEPAAPVEPEDQDEPTPDALRFRSPLRADLTADDLERAALGEDRGNPA